MSQTTLRTPLLPMDGVAAHSPRSGTDAAQIQKEEQELMALANLSDEHAGHKPEDFWLGLRWTLHRYVDHLAVRGFGMLLVLVDVIVAIVAVAKYGKDEDANPPPAYDRFALFVIIYFLLDVSLRIFALGPRHFFTKVVEVFDFVIIVVSAILTFVGIGEGRYVVFIRLFRLVFLLRLVSENLKLTGACRLKISENKRRYRYDGFDLDLTYVTDRVIAMSFPSTGFRALYRNPLSEVARFFNTKHKGHYMIINCCSERDYDHSKFYDCVDNCPIDDHNVPTLQQIVGTCEKIERHLTADPENVVAVHCKGGKGRTGTIICSWLLWDQQTRIHYPEVALNHFARRRTDLAVSQQFQGVQTPSQSRFVGYIEEIVNKYNRQLPPTRTKHISAIRVISLPVSQDNPHGARNLSVQISCDNQLVFDFENARSAGQASSAYGPETAESGRHVATTTFELGNLEVSGAIKVKFFAEGLPAKYDHCPFYFWFHTSFVSDPSRLYIPRELLDNPHKPKSWKYYDEDFAVEVLFADSDV
eukprot:m.356658 g.356658  ORF g.356658 m.356658 type:complete len:530 (+) comp17595_c0_seq1:171-1760(+)